MGETNVSLVENICCWTKDLWGRKPEGVYASMRSPDHRESAVYADSGGLVLLCADVKRPEDLHFS